MKTAAGIVTALFVGALASGFGVARANAADAPAPAPDAAVEAGEPNVRRTVIEDSRTRIEELRVRGRVQHITVDPKGRAPSYQIITGDGPPDFADGVSPSRGAAGKRVWNVFRF